MSAQVVHYREVFMTSWRSASLISNEGSTGVDVRLEVTDSFHTISLSEEMIPERIPRRNLT